MTLTQAMALGSTGEEIDYLLSEIIEAIETPQDFDDKEHQLEYIGTTIDMIKLQLTKLQEK